ncbi:hypothetical protein R80B4_02095 [Fibrobacteres bacterium R8-0-B4]
MNKVKPNFRIAALKHPEELEYRFSIWTVVERLTPAALDLVKLAPVYKAAVDRYDKAVKIDRSSKLTQIIDTHHDKLVQAMHGLSLAVAAVEHRLDSESAAEGALLRHVLDRYKTNLHTNYEVAADNAHNLLYDLKDNEYADRVAKHRLGDWTLAINAVLASYRNLVADRFDEIGALPVGERPKPPASRADTSAAPCSSASTPKSTTGRIYPPP